MNVDPGTPTDRDEPGEWAAIGGLLLIGALVAAVLLAWSNPVTAGQYEVKQADGLLRDGRYLEAVDLLERTLVTYSAPDARLELSYAYLARRDAERAQSEAQLVTETAPPGLQPAAWAQMGRVLSFEGHDDQALSAWSKSVQAAAPFSTNPPVEAQARSSTWHIAMTHWAGGEWDAARSDLAPLQSGDDVYAASAEVKLAQLLAPTDRTSALQLLDEAARWHPTEVIPQPLGIKSAAVPDMNLPGLSEGLPPQVITGTVRELRDAIGQVDKLEQSGPSRAVVDATWGAAFLQQNEPRLAQLYLQRALALQPDFADAHARLGVALLNLGDTRGALSQLQTAVQIDPGQPLPHHVLASIYIQQGAWPQARAEFQTLGRIEQDNVQLHIQMADYYTDLGEYDKAEEQYITAAGLQSAAGQQASGDVPASIDAPLLLVRFYMDVRGQGCDKGLSVARQYAPAHPGDPAWLDATGWGFVLCGQPKDALSALQRAVSLDPKTPRYHYHLGKAYALLGRYTDAREQFNRVRDLDPGGSWEHLAVSDLVNLPQ